MERVYRPDSVQRLPVVTVIPLDRRLPDGSSHQPARSEGRPVRRKPRACLFGVAPGGVLRAVPVTRSAVGSYPTFSPLPATGCPVTSAVCFLCHCPSPWAQSCNHACCAWPLTSTLPAGVRTFLPGICMPRRLSDPLRGSLYPRLCNKRLTTLRCGFRSAMTHHRRADTTGASCRSVRR
jgi:hypothetical protein